MKPVTIVLVVIYLALFCFIFSSCEPNEVAVVENAGKVLEVKNYCLDREVVYAQNGENKKIELSLKCFDYAVVEWCKHPSKKQGCTVEDTKPSFGSSWGFDGRSLNEYLEMKAKKTNKRVTEVSFKAGDTVSVAYLQGAWIPTRTMLKNIKIFKWLPK